MDSHIEEFGWSAESKAELALLFKTARANKLWFRHNGLAGEFWFSPDELAAEQRNGNFRWGAVNWTLRSPDQKLALLDAEIAHLQKQRREFAERVR